MMNEISLQSESPRHLIIKEFAAWTALSALRSGSPVKDRVRVYGIIHRIDFDEVLSGSRPISQAEFNTWHKQVVEVIATELSLCVGWCVKIVNVYLKTTSYVGDLGRPGLREVIHPPIDGILWKAVEKGYAGNQNILSLTHSKRLIRDIKTYADYQKIISGLELVSTGLACTLFEVEQLWQKQ